MSSEEWRYNGKCFTYMAIVLLTWQLFYLHGKCFTYMASVLLTWQLFTYMTSFVAFSVVVIHGVPSIFLATVGSNPEITAEAPAYQLCTK